MNGVSLRWFTALFNQERTGDFAGGFTRSILLALLVLGLTVLISVLGRARVPPTLFRRDVRVLSRGGEPHHAGAAGRIGGGSVCIRRSDGRRAGTARGWVRSSLDDSVRSVIMFAVLSRFNRSYEEAGRDLGASNWQIFWLVVVPILFPGMIAVALFGFTLSTMSFRARC
jgi:putative spermidine/putrescine transport system permease protein